MPVLSLVYRNKDTSRVEVGQPLQLGGAMAVLLIDWKSCRVPEAATEPQLYARGWAPRDPFGAARGV